MIKDKNLLIEEMEQDIEPVMLTDYENLDVEDDVFYTFNTKTYYGAKSWYASVDNYDFDNYGYNDWLQSFYTKKPPG